MTATERGIATLDMLMASGHVAGQAIGVLYWALDGRAYKHYVNRNVAVLIGDWFDFCAAVRAGRVRGELNHIPRATP